jgi:hypothetical protein
MTLSDRYELECHTCGAETGQPIDGEMADWLEEEHADAHPDHEVERTRVEDGTEARAAP